MAIIETKYSVGDVVFFAGTVTERKSHDCPDCLGKRKWKATSPAGTDYEFSCPRCTAQYMSDRDLSIDYTAHVPSVRKLTIGSVQFNSAPGVYDEGARYMCVETGVGSGSVYDEAKLFSTEEDAAAASKAMADEANARTDWIVRLYDKSLAISDYQLESAKIKLADDAKSRIGSMFWNVGYLFEKIEEADDKDAILEEVEFYRSYDWQRDKDRFSEEFAAKFAKAEA